jgi:hypothetical protein
MSKLKLKEIEVGETRHFTAEQYGYRGIDHMRRNISVAVHQLLKSHKGRLITIMTVGDTLHVRRWK